VARSLFDDREQLRRRAQELRDLAARMSSDAAKEQLFRMAEDYERLARVATRASIDANGGSNQGR
jgi:hypothetical protein